MPRKRLPEDQRLVAQGLKISPLTRKRIESLPIAQKKRVLAAMREAVEIVVNSMINSMPDNVLQPLSGNAATKNGKDNFIVDSP